ncbi:MAG: GNAT family N-acetyltransferase [Anaerolineae bacterium]|nr:GNAT family N-acetyltransferase [Anaerolineae bacterium]
MTSRASQLPQDLGDGLVLRRATVDDTEAVADFNAHVHSDQGWDQPDESVGIWVKGMMSGDHPTMAPGDFLVVEDTKAGAVVSSTCLIPQTWSYAGIPFDVGRIELVGTHLDYRRRGLVRAQFDVLHAWSAERGHLVQGITGIPWYYRQFGYEMAPGMHGGRRGAIAHVPELKEDQEEPYRIRPATPEDLGFIAEVAALGNRRKLLSCMRDAAIWRYELDGRTSRDAGGQLLRVIETPAGDSVGFCAHPDMRWGRTLALLAYELAPGISWWAVTPSVMRYLAQAGAGLPPYYPSPDGGPVFDTLAFSLGHEHPAYDIVQDWLPEVRNPYAWYTRVPDLPAFLRHIVPVLEQRLAGSVLVGHSGTLKLDFYRGGVRLVLEEGRIVEITPWSLATEEDQAWPSGFAFVGFPALTFLQVLFGYRSLEELQHAYADCGGNLEGRLLVNTLFPKQHSAIWPIS